MTYKLIWRRLALLLVILLGVSWGYTQTVSAAGSGTSGAATYKTVTGDRLLAEDGYAISNYIAFSTVTANNIQSNRLTKYTDKIYVNVDSDYKVLQAKGFTFSKAYLDVVDSSGKSLMTSKPVQASISGTSATFSTSKQTLSVDLSKLGTQDLQLPIYVGVTFSSTTPNPDGSTRWMAYGFGKFEQDETTLNNMKDITIDQPVKLYDTKITGTAEPGAAISATLNGNAVTTTADADGKYTLTPTLPLMSSGQITVYESNDMGDTKSASTDLQMSVPVISAGSKDLTITPSKLETLTSDAEVIDWISNEAKLKVQDSMTANVDLDAAYSSTDSDLVKKLTDLASGDSTTIDIGATSKGVKAPDDVKITITKSAGELKFTTVSDKLSYGSLQVPNTTTLFAPTSAPDVEISDTRATGSAWRVTASAAPLATADGTHKLSGQLMYVNATGQAQSLATSQTVASGTRTKGEDSINVTNGWETQSDQPSGIGKAGIYLQAKPSIYTGNGTTSYSGTVTWALTDAP